MKKIDAIPFLLETGLLFEINRCVLHPLNLGLEANVGGDGTGEIRKVWDCRGGTALRYDEEVFSAGVEKLANYMLASGDLARFQRFEELGYRVQGEVVEPLFFVYGDKTLMSVHRSFPAAYSWVVAFLEKRGYKAEEHVLCKERSWTVSAEGAWMDTVRITEVLTGQDLSED